MNGDPTSVLHFSLDIEVIMGEHEKQMNEKSDMEAIWNPICS